MPRPGPGAPCRPLPSGLWILQGEWPSAGRSRLHQPGLSVPAGTRAAPHSGPVSSLRPWPLSTPRAPKQECIWARPSACRCPLYVRDPAFLGAHRWPQGLAEDPQAAAGPRGSQGGPRVPAPPARPRPGVRAPLRVICPLPFALSPGPPQSSQAPWRAWESPQLTSGPGFPTRSHPQGSGAPLSSLWRRPGCFLSSSPGRSADASSLERPAPLPEALRPTLPQPLCSLPGSRSVVSDYM